MNYNISTSRPRDHCGTVRSFTISAYQTRLLLLLFVYYGYLCSASRRRLSRGALSVTGRRKEVFKLRMDAGDIPCSITLRRAGGVLFQSTEPTTAKAQFRDREVQDQGTRRSQRSEYSRREGRADSGLDMSSHGYLGARPCWDLATRSRTLYLTRQYIGSQCKSLIM